ncbi:hypothetical protein BDE36_1216 [Arcticibacter tournemirensis]|uniref:hypothetical protein n=1 Tax=Arcticibacter tournemirensis TaxID=699437 RepID=UPI001151FED7|nr:hypothetical protein [Arcticibacter tournemirensis]TQM49511.1 hypothetical protein BDE36_1216 [Arcticibacter tournemirensis]
MRGFPFPTLLIFRPLTPLFFLSAVAPGRTMAVPEGTLPPLFIGPPSEKYRKSYGRTTGATDELPIPARCFSDTLLGKSGTCPGTGTARVRQNAGGRMGGVVRMPGGGGPGQRTDGHG